MSKVLAPFPPGHSFQPNCDKPTLRDIMEALGLSARDLSIRSDLSRTTIDRILYPRKKDSDISIYTAAKICAVLGKHVGVRDLQWPHNLSNRAPAIGPRGPQQRLKKLSA